MVTLFKQSRIFPWLVCGLGALFYCYEYFLRVSPSVMTSELMHSYQINATALGNLAAFYYYAYTPMQLPVGVTMDYYGPRRLLIFACLVCAIGTYLFGFSHHLWVAQIGRFMVGFGSAFAFVGVLKLATIWLPSRYFGMIAGLATTLGLILGAVACDFVLTELIHLQGWRSTVVISAVAGIVLALIIGLFMPDTHGQLQEADEPQSQAWKHLGQGLLQLLSKRDIWLNGFIGCALYLPLSAFAEMWGVPYLQAAHHFSAIDAAHFNSLVFIGFGVGGPIFGFASDLLGCRRLPVIIAAILTTLTSCTLLLVANLTQLEVGILLFLLGASASGEVLVFAIGRELSTQSLAATAMAVTNCLVMVGGMIFQPLVGYVLDFKAGVHGTKLVSTAVYTANDYQYALITIPIMAALSIIALIMLRKSSTTLSQSDDELKQAAV